MTHTESSRVNGLQVARAIAALSVAYFHSYVALRSFPESAQIPIELLRKWGFLGVNLFFGISGYVICLVASKPDFAPIPFVIKRVFRLYPMYWFALALVILFIVWGYYRTEPLGHFLYSMTLLPQPGPSAYDISWTLEREMVFYALAAIIVPIAGIPGLALVLAALTYAGWHFGNPWSFHLISTTHVDFLAGVLVFLLRRPLSWLGAALPIIGGGALFLYTRSNDFAFSVTISFGIVLAGLVNLRIDRKRLYGRTLIALGDASYSIYLMHYPALILAGILAATWGPPAWLCEPWRFGALVACCLASCVTWRWIEQPMIRLGNRLTASQKTPVVQPAVAENPDVVQEKFPVALTGRPRAAR